ncbi:MAG: serine/threonine-protein kinase [Polyangiaceae bacterium]
MLAGMFTCPSCKGTHRAGTLVCPTTRKTIPLEAAGTPRPPEASKARSPVAKEAPAPAAGAAAGARSDKKAYEDWIGRVIDDRYVLRGVIGRGGMGTVFQAEHVSLQRPVAIKVLNPTQALKKVAVQRFQNEARASGAIGHPNICGVYDLGTLPDGLPYLVMEFLHGESLQARIQRERQLPIPIVIGIMSDILAGLEAAHKKNILHRDIKPENIFLVSKPRPLAKVVDFGVSKMSFYDNEGGEGEQLTKTGMVMGTPYYMSAEQARGLRDLDARVDVYACGVILYEMLTGIRPFVAKNHHDLLLQIIKQDAKPATDIRPDVPKELGDVLIASMMRDRAKRYPTAAYFRKELLAVAQKLGITPVPHMAPEPRPRMPSRDDAATRVARLEGAPGKGARFEPTMPPAKQGESAEDWPTQVYQQRKEPAVKVSQAKADPVASGSGSMLELGTGDIVGDEDDIWEMSTEKAVPGKSKKKNGPPSTRRRGGP